MLILGVQHVLALHSTTTTTKGYCNKSFVPAKIQIPTGSQSRYLVLMVAEKLNLQRSNGPVIAPCSHQVS
jgi:hypothetical protein